MGETSWFEGLEHQLKHPDKSNFKGKAQNGFYKHWNKLKKIAHQTKPLVIFDEIERLLDFPGELDPHILSFLESFVCNPENGCFILAGSEKIRYSQNKQFADLVAKGEPHVRVGHYNEAAVQSIFVKVQTFLKYEEEILQYLIALCDGHPRFLDTILEILISLRGGRLSGVRRVGTTEIEFIRNMVMDRMSDVLWALWKRLSSEEFVVVQLMSKRIPQPFNPFECSLQDLVELAEQHFVEPTVSYELLKRGIAELEEREWVACKDREKELFHVKLGILPFWVERRCITRVYEVTNR